MTPSTSTLRAQQSSEERTSQRRPTFDDVIQALTDAGLTPTEAGALYGLFKQLADLTEFRERAGTTVYSIAKLIDDPIESAWVEEKLRYYAAILLDSSDPRHAHLEQVMPDLTVASPGSLHELLERHFLAEGDRFVHDFNKSCVIAVQRAH